MHGSEYTHLKPSVFKVLVDGIRFEINDEPVNDVRRSFSLCFKLSAADNLKRLGFTFVLKEVELPVTFDNAWITATKSHFLGILKKRKLCLAVLKRGAVLRSSTPYWDITK
ncbi:hypothetical protein Ancab_002305 [Ancistrocladus abbreviatus]